MCSRLRKSGIELISCMMSPHAHCMFSHKTVAGCSPEVVKVQMEIQTGVMRPWLRTTPELGIAYINTLKSHHTG
ncbi:MAG: hypothetical protein IKD10_11490 [Lentisphaeria bacterium]|nr:hypothetical protein [Lentisphaeria bacterium]MBR7145549.1 hypothetical protein [Lentisphaeria bacterium]